MSEPTELPHIARPNTTRRTQLLMALCILTTAGYLVYRGMYTLHLESWYSSVASWLLYAAEIWGGISLFLFFLQIWDPTEEPAQPPLEGVTIDVFVPSYNEDIMILRGTLQACLAMDYPHRTYLLDDGNREEMRQLCEELGVHYITRDNNLHAKAGNLNHAFDQTDGEFVAILDADHVPEPNFLSRMLGYFRDPKLGFVQSPHAFSNFDTFQGRVNYEKQRFWDEGQLFYKVIQPGRNYTNSVIFAGSAALFRRKALKDVGYIATETITEDMHTGIRMSAKGWKSMYVNERLIAGQGAADVTTFHSQRLRWAQGNLSILWYDNPLTTRGLSLVQRLTYFASIIHWASGIPRLAIYATPILLLLTGVPPVERFTWTLGSIFLAYIVTMLVTLKVVFRGYTNYSLNEYFNMANFWTQCRAVTLAIIQRKRAKFVVTNKRGGKQGSRLPHVLPQIILMAVGMAAILYGWTRHVMFGETPDMIGMGIATALVLHNSYFALVYLRVAMQGASRRSSYRHRMNLAVQYKFPNREGKIVEGIGVTTDLNEFGLGMMSYDTLPTNVRGEVSVRVNGDTLTSPCLIRYAAHRVGDGLEGLPLYRYGVDFEEMPPQSIDAASRMIQRYAVAPWYSAFEAAEGGRGPKRALVSRRSIDRAPFKVPVCLTTSKGTIFTCTRDISTEAMRCILAHPLEIGDVVKAQVFSPQGAFTATVRVAGLRHVTGPPHRVRENVLTFVSFDGQGRSLLQSLCELADEAEVRQGLMCRHEKRRRPVVRPMAAAAAMLLLLTPPTVGLFQTVYADDLALVEASYSAKADPDHQRFNRILNESLTTDDKDVQRLLLLKSSLEKEERFDDLVRVCHLLVAAMPDDPDMGMALVAALTSAKRYKDAELRAYQWTEALRDQGRTDKVKKFEVLAARNLLRSGDHFAALEIFRRVFVMDPSDRLLRKEYLGVLLQVGLGQEALRQFSGLPQDEETLRDLVTIYSSMSDFKNAELTLMRLIQKRPNDSELQLELGNLLIWQRDFASAVQVFRDLQKANPNDATKTVALAEVLTWSGQSEEAIRLFEDLLDRGDNGDRTLKGFLDAYLAIDKPSPSQFARVHWLHKRHLYMKKLPAASAGALASALARAGQLDEAIGLIRDALAQDPNNADLRLRLADALVLAGKPEEAHPHYRALLSTEQHRR